MVFNGFKSLGEHFGIVRSERKEKVMKCHACGKEMKHIEGTNIFLCECGKQLMTKMKPAETNLVR